MRRAVHPELPEGNSAKSIELKDERMNARRLPAIFIAPG
jgi:hypothetical protein